MLALNILAQNVLALNVLARNKLAQNILPSNNINQWNRKLFVLCGAVLLAWQERDSSVPSTEIKIRFSIYCLHMGYEKPSEPAQPLSLSHSYRMSRFVSILTYGI